jgi:mannonate dehydratase
MFAVMKELVKNKYKQLIHPEHPRALDYDTQQPGFEAQYPGGGGYAGWAFNVAYTRAYCKRLWILRSGPVVTCVGD